MKINYNYICVIIFLSCNSSIHKKNNFTEINNIYNNGDYSGCLSKISDKLNNDINLTEKEKAELKYINSKCYYALDRDFECIEEIDKIIDYYYNDTLVYMMRGDCYKSLTYYNLAFQEYRKILKIDPTSAGTYNRIGHLHFLLFEFNEALINIDSALQFQPNMYEALVNKSNI